MRIFLTLLALASSLSAQSLGGLWDCTVTVDNVPIPFRMEMSGDGSAVKGSFFNGEERLASTTGELRDGHLTIQFSHYASTVNAAWKDGHWVGTYDRLNRTSYPFEARRFTPVEEDATDVPKIAGLWDVAAKSSKGETTWLLIVRQSGASVSAAIQRVDGDTGAIEGSYRNGKFLLSHFDGARPLVLEITPGANGTLDVLHNAKNKLTAVRATEARAKGIPEPTDPSRYTTMKDPSEPFHFRFPDLTGKIVTDDNFKGKVVLVDIMGSWCPNCHDEAPFLVELYKKYRSKGFVIVGISFEEPEQVTNPTRLRFFIKNYGIEYPMLLGGATATAAEHFPQVVNLATWPMTFFLGRDGRVRSTHAGFASKATGELHTHLKEEYARTLERLLAEN